MQRSSANGATDETDGQVLYRLIALKGEYDIYARELSAPLLRVHDAWRSVHPHKASTFCSSISGHNKRQQQRLYQHRQQQQQQQQQEQQLQQQLLPKDSGDLFASSSSFFNEALDSPFVSSGPSYRAAISRAQLNQSSTTMACDGSLNISMGDYSSLSSSSSSVYSYSSASGYSSSSSFHSSSMDEAYSPNGRSRRSRPQTFSDGLHLTSNGRLGQRHGARPCRSDTSDGDSGSEGSALLEDERAFDDGFGLCVGPPRNAPKHTEDLEPPVSDDEDSLPTGSYKRSRVDAGTAAKGRKESRKRGNNGNKAPDAKKTAKRSRTSASNNVASATADALVLPDEIVGIGGAEAAVPPTSLPGVLAYVRGIVERAGGSAHIDTIIDLLKTQWQRNQVVKFDGSFHGHAECKKSVQGALRSKIGKEQFTKDPACMGCYALTPECAAAILEQQVPPAGKVSSGSRKDRRSGAAANSSNKESQPLHVLLRDTIPEDGCMFLDDLYAYIEEHWTYYDLRHFTPDRTDAREMMNAAFANDSSKLSVMSLSMRDNPLSSRYYSVAERNLRIRATLMTHPWFDEDEDNADYFILASTHAKRTTATTSSRKDATNSESPAGGRQRALRGTVPPLGFVCRCGATDPRGLDTEPEAEQQPARSVRKAAAVASTAFSSGDSRWRKTPAGEFLCITCADARLAQLTCPVCAESYRDTADTNWIRCDDCLRWVMMGCDKELVNLALYDDDNENALHYSCPRCRDEWETYSIDIKAASTTRRRGSGSRR